MRVLLHTCCGPCAIMPLRMLREAGHEVVGYFYNPNIHPLMEYVRRSEAMQHVAELESMPMIWDHGDYAAHDWLSLVYERGLSNNVQGARCRFCYAHRLEQAAKVAQKEGFEAYTTSLLYSTYQRHEFIREEGDQAVARLNTDEAPVFLYKDFRFMWQQGQDAAKSMPIYRQNYCACLFSEAERHMGKLRRLPSSS